MKQGSTLFLKIAVFLIGAPVLALCIFLLYCIFKESQKGFSGFEYLLIGIPIVMYASATSFFMALHQAFKLLSYIDKNEAFTEISVIALKKIKHCAITISGLYVIGMPFFYYFAKLAGAPGVMLFGLFVIFSSMVIAVFAAVLQRLLQEAINIKSENDLTV